jgi:hypothetical protein
MLGKATGQEARGGSACSQEQGTEQPTQPTDRNFESDAGRDGRADETPRSGHTRRTGLGFELGVLSLAGLAITELQPAHAEPGNDGLLDDGIIAYKDLEHGVFVLVTKEPNPRVITVDDPETSVILHPNGSGVAVNAVSNAGQVASLEAAYQGAFQTFSLGQQDPGVQHDVQPQSNQSSPGSSFIPINFVPGSGDSTPGIPHPQGGGGSGPPPSPPPIIPFSFDGDPVLPPPFVPTLVVTVSGQAVKGTVLTADPVANEPATLAYQWQRSADGGKTWTDILGATAPTYKLGEGDENHVVRVHTLLTDGTGQTVSANSDPTASVVDVFPTLSVTVTGSAIEGQALTAHAVAVSDESETVHYRWQSSADGGKSWTDISGAITPTYTLGEGDENHLIRVHTSLTDDTGQTVTANSDPTASVVDVFPTLSVTVTGSAIERQTLTAHAVAGSDESETVHYQWQSSADGGKSWTDISGATAPTYTLGEGHENHLIRVHTSLTDDTGQTVTANSAPTAAVIDAPPSLTVTVAGTAQEGQALKAAAVLMCESDDPGNIHYQWQYSTNNGQTWQNISGATGTTYTVRESDEGRLLRVEASYSAEGQSAVADSAPTARVIDANPSLSASETYQSQQGAFVIVPADGSHAVQLNIAAQDSDGDNLAIVINGFPADVNLTDNHGDHLTIVNGQITLTRSELAGLTLHTGHTAELISLTVTAENTEGGATTTPEPLQIAVSQHIRTWQGESDTWSDGENWTSGSEHSGPGASDDAVITEHGGAYTVTIDGAHDVANSLTVSSADATVLDGANHSLTLTKALTIVAGAFDVEGGGVSASAVAVEASGKLTGHGLVNGSVKDFGMVEAKGGVLELSGDVNGPGTLAIDSGATLRLDGADTGSVTFANNAGDTGTLLIEHSAGFAATVSGFSQHGPDHDVIDLADVDFTKLKPAAFDAGTNALTISDGTQTASIAFHGNFSIGSFQFFSDGHGGTSVIDPPAGNGVGGAAQVVAFDLSGNETFAFQPGFGNATISGFANSGGVADKIELDGFQGIVDFTQLQSLLHATNGGQDTLIDLAHGDSITLSNVQVASLHSSDFIIHHA